MIKPPNAAEFLTAWADACASRQDILFRDWPNWREFTSHVFSDPDCIIKSVSERLGLRCYCGYYCIDAILFTEDDLVPRRPAGTTWVRRVRVAFEHENGFYSGLFQEVSHLLITDCDLRVLVSYPDSREDLDGELQYLHNIIAGTDRAAHIAEGGTFLFIAGSRDVEKKAITWSGYVYDRTGWRRL